MACRGASLHQKSPPVGEVLKSRNTATARSPRQAMSCHLELNDRPLDEWCMFYFLRLARVGLQSEKISTDRRSNECSACRTYGRGLFGLIAWVDTFISCRYVKIGRKSASYE